MMEYDRVRLKMTARQALKYQRPHPMLITLLFTILVNVGSRIISEVLSLASGGSSLSDLYLHALLEYEDPGLAIQYALLSFTPQQLILALLVGVVITNIIVALWTGLMRTGYSGFCLGMVRGQQPQTGTLFSAFPLWAGVLLTQFLVGLFVVLWTLLFCVGAAVLIGVITLLFSQLPSEMLGLMFILYLVIYIAFIVGIVWVSLRYAMVNFIIIDQDITGLDAIRESKRLMRGNAGRLFVLRLSFIGWYLLEAAILLVIVIIAIPTVGAGMLSAGDLEDAMAMIAGGALALFGVFVIAAVGIAIFNLWLTPYITGTEALFYDWLHSGARPMGGYSGPGGYGGQGGQGGWGQPPQQNSGYNWTPTPGSNSGRGIGSGQQGGPQPPQQPPRAPRDDS